MTQLDARTLAFLHESNAIEDIHNVDYGDPANAQPGRGHVGALLDALDRAGHRTPLDVAELCRWQGWLTDEQVRFGHAMPAGGIGRLRSPENPANVHVGGHQSPDYHQVPALIAQWVTDLHEELGKLRPPFVTGVQVADRLGAFFQRFEAIHPFVDGNGRTGRLVAAYIAEYCGYPLIVFRAAERFPFYAAHTSKMAMRAFMADKVREAGRSPDGVFWERIDAGGNADRYRAADGREMVMEWHDLVAAKAEWQAAALAKLNRR